jgi:hypothetical protein
MNETEIASHVAQLLPLLNQSRYTLYMVSGVLVLSFITAQLMSKPGIAVDDLLSRCELQEAAC